MEPLFPESRQVTDAVFEPSSPHAFWKGSFDDEDAKDNEESCIIQRNTIDNSERERDVDAISSMSFATDSTSSSAIATMDSWNSDDGLSMLSPPTSPMPRGIKRARSAPSRATAVATNGRIVDPPLEDSEAAQDSTLLIPLVRNKVAAYHAHPGCPENQPDVKEITYNEALQLWFSVRRTNSEWNRTLFRSLFDKQWECVDSALRVFAERCPHATTVCRVSFLVIIQLFFFEDDRAFCPAVIDALRSADYERVRDVICRTNHLRKWELLAAVRPQLGLIELVRIFETRSTELERFSDVASDIQEIIDEVGAESATAVAEAIADKATSYGVRADAMVMWLLYAEPSGRNIDKIHSASKSKRRCVRSDESL